LFGLPLYSSGLNGAALEPLKRGSSGGNTALLKAGQAPKKRGLAALLGLLMNRPT